MVLGSDYRASGLAVTFAATALAAGNLVPNPEFRLGDRGQPLEWSTWSPRAELAPEMRARDGELHMRARRFADYGKWIAVARGIEPGRYYRFETYYRPEGIAAEETSVAAVLSWCRDEDGKTAVQRDYAETAPAENGCRRV
jgi:hypothetical protein